MANIWRKSSGFRLKECAELSSPVMSANQHQIRYLNKTIRILERSETTLINTITIEQKIMYRRFQEKLYRSKINFARMWSDKEMERRLRAQKLSYLNSNNGDIEAEAAFLKHLKRRALDGQLSPADLLSEDSEEADVNKFIETIVVAQKDPLLTLVSYPGNRRGSLTSPSSRQILRPSHLRPVTAIGSNVDQEFHVMPGMPGATTEEKFKNFINIVKSGEDYEGGSEADQSNDSDMPKTLSLRPKTCSGIIERRHTTGHDDAGHLAPPAPTGTQMKKRRSIFIEYSKQEELNKEINKIKAMDYRPRIKEFCASLEPYIWADDGENLDYYSRKILDSITTSEANKQTKRLTTPDKERRRFIGDINVRNSTLCNLKWKF